MLRRLMSLFSKEHTGPAVDLPSLPRDQVAHLFQLSHGLPHVDWGMAEAWLSHQDPSHREGLRRAIAAAWMDQLREAVPTDSRRWRRGIVEGLAPLEGSTAMRLASAADKAVAEIGRALIQVCGDEPIAPIAVIGLGTHDEYYSFVSHFYPDEGEFATSGGLYIRSDGESFPVLTVAAQAHSSLEATTAHELTHHALRDCNLPLWAEEGLTQMMEERVTGRTEYVVGREMLNRHRALWLEFGFDALLDGSGFHCPEGEVQELSYHMSQMLVRGLLSTRPKDFFAFARACKTTPAEHAAAEHLGAAPDRIAFALLR